jgi:hypothetical protein
VLVDRAGVELPSDIRVEVNGAAARLAGTTVTALLEDAARRLEQKGALTGTGEVTGSVQTNLHGLLAGRQRVRVGYGGRGRATVAYHWVAPGAGGSLTRSGDAVELSAYDDRRLGAELLRVLPDHPDAPRPPDHELVWRLDDVAAAGAVHEELDEVPTDAAARALGVEPGQWESLRGWLGGHRGVLHCVVPDPRGGPSVELVWFDTDAGWWALLPRDPGGDRGGDREVVARWRRTAEVLTDLAQVTTRWWT